MRGVREDPRAEAERRQKIAEATRATWRDEAVAIRRREGIQRAHAEGRIPHEQFRGLARSATSQWKGDAVGYRAAHTRIQRARGAPAICEHCGTESATRYEWAFDEERATVVLVENGRRYSPDADAYVRLCQPCHREMDR